MLLIKVKYEQNLIKDINKLLILLNLYSVSMDFYVNKFFLI